MVGVLEVMRILTALLITLIAFAPAEAKRLHYEKTYQKHFCYEIGGGIEFTLLDKSGRVDCITKDYAIEADFADKWAESIGQALYYGLMTDRQPGILLILEQQSDHRHLDKLLKVAEKYNIRVWTITPADLKK